MPNQIRTNPKQFKNKKNMKKFKVNTTVSFSRSGSKYNGMIGVITKLRDRASSPYGVLFEDKTAVVWCDGKFLTPVVEETPSSAPLAIGKVVKNVGRGPVGGKTGIIVKFRTLAECPEGKTSTIGVKYYDHSTNNVVWTKPENLMPMFNFNFADVVVLNNPKSKRNGQTGTVHSFRANKETSVGVKFTADKITWCKPSSLSHVSTNGSDHDVDTTLEVAPMTDAPKIILNFNGVTFNIDADAEVSINGKNISINN